jgi:hypothetical protein
MTNQLTPFINENNEMSILSIFKGSVDSISDPAIKKLYQIALSNLEGLGKLEHFSCLNDVIISRPM